MKVMVRDKTAHEAIDILEEAGIETIVDNEKLTPEQLSEIVGDIDGLIVRSSTHVNEDVVKAAHNLKVVGRAGVGVDNIDLNAATAGGIVVMNAPGGNTVTTGEHTIAMLMALARNIPQATASCRDGKWEKAKFRGVEVAEKTLGIVGLGHVGQVVANRARGLKMKVIVFDPFVTPKAAEKFKVELVTLDELFERSDFITVHTPKTEETKNLVRSETIAKMKDGVRIINCARGGIVSEADLYEAVKSGKIAGAALDVFEVEPPECSPLFELPNVILTPHLGANTSEAQVNVAVMIAHQMVDFLNKGTITNAVNFPSISAEDLKNVRPYLDLSERMGSMLGQLITRLDGVGIEYQGDINDYDTRPITHAILKGLLGSFMDIPVNDVNAPAIARRRGINVVETVSGDITDYANLIKITVRGNSEEVLEIWGTLFGNKHPRIVQMGGIYLDAIPEGAILVIRNWDKPGVIGNLGTLLGKHDINIARFQLGRREGQTMCLVNVDTLVDEDVIKKIADLPNIITVQQVTLNPLL